MLFLHDPRRRQHSHPSRDQDRLRVSLPERLHLLKKLIQRGRYLPETHLSLVLERRLKICWRQTSPGMRIKLASQLDDVRGWQCETHGMGVSAITIEQLAA